MNVGAHFRCVFLNTLSSFTLQLILVTCINIYCIDGTLLKLFIRLTVSDMTMAQFHGGEVFVINTNFRLTPYVWAKGFNSICSRPLLKRQTGGIGGVLIHFRPFLPDRENYLSHWIFSPQISCSNHFLIHMTLALHAFTLQ